jgi:hypothetical protein
MHRLLLLPVLPLQLQGMLSPFGELKDCVVIVEKMSQKSKVRDYCCSCRASYELFWLRCARATACMLKRASAGTGFSC